MSTNLELIKLALKSSSFSNESGVKLELTEMGYSKSNDHCINIHRLSTS